MECKTWCLGGCWNASLLPGRVESVMLKLTNKNCGLRVITGNRVAKLVDNDLEVSVIWNLLTCLCVQLHFHKMRCLGACRETMVLDEKPECQMRSRAASWEASVANEKTGCQM